MPSASAYLDMILLDPILRDYSGFRAVCRLAFDQFQNDPYFLGHQPKTKAYDIVSGVYDVYFKNKKSPTTKKHLANRIGVKALARWSTTANGSKDEHREFRQKLITAINEWKNSN